MGWRIYEPDPREKPLTAADWAQVLLILLLMFAVSWAALRSGY